MTQARKFIVWDWNGTLIEDLPLNVQCFNKTIALSGKPPIDIARYQETFEVPIEIFYCKNGFSQQEMATVMQSFQQSFHDAYNEGILAVGFRAGAKEILQNSHANDVDHIILSNHLAPSIEEHLDRLEARHLFHAVLAHEDLTSQLRWAKKGERLALFMQEHGLIAKNGFIVGDTPEETHIAKQTGLTSIALTGGFASEIRLREAAPDYLINELRSLHPILQQRGFIS